MNIMLDGMPTEYEGYLIRTDFRIGMQISEALNDVNLADPEKMITAIHLLYGRSVPADPGVAEAGLRWFMRGGKEDVKIGAYFRVDNYGKRFEIYGDRNSYKFDDLVNFELYENDGIEAKGGIGRAIVGGALFGGVGAVVGAATRKSESKVNSLYIRLTLKSVGMKKIVFISSSTPRNSFVYKTQRKAADEIMSQLELIAENNKVESETARIHQEQTEAAAPSVSVADELLKLKQLLDIGVLTDEEFQQQKQKLLNK